MSTDAPGATQRSAGVADTLQAGGASEPRPGASGQVADLAAGTILDGVYRVVARIGGGAMGVVYLVEHQGLGRRFAAKVVASVHNTDPEILARFRNEARVASSIQHENIVDVTHLGRTPDGSLFVVMELLEGCDLRHRLVEAEANPASPWLPDEETRRIARGVLAGLEVAHDAGIVHRDLKPDNIFLSTKGGVARPKIVDFGISKAAPSGEGDMRLTRTGQIIGTPLYMSPEQTRGSANVDRRSDIYAIGVILYEMTTGCLPFEATSIYDLIVKHATEPPPPPTTRRPNLPPAVDAVIVRCLAKKPDDRFQTAREVLDAWEAAWNDVAAAAPRAPSVVPAVPIVEASESLPSPPPSRGPAWAIGVVGLVVVIAIAVTMFGRAPDATVVATRAGAPAPSSAPSSPPPSEMAPLPPPPSSDVPRGAEPPADVHRLITTDPPGASIDVAGRSAGVTPFDLVLRAGAPTEVTVRSIGRRPVTRTITSDDPDTIALTLDRAPPRTHAAEPGLPALAPH